MRKYKVAIIYAAIFFFQPFLGAILPVLNMPNLILCVTLMQIILGKEEETGTYLIWGSVFSLLVDIAFYQFWAVSVISLLMAAAIALVLKRLINNENTIMAAVTIVVVSLSYNFSYWLISVLIGSPYGFIYMLKYAIAIAVADLAVCLIIYFMRIGKIIQARRDRYFR